MPGRKYSANNYRYGFNGKENDNEVKGAGNSLDFGARIYDPRIGKFLSVDGFTSKYPSFSPYMFAGNSPIAFIDKNGDYLYLVTTDSKTGEKIAIKITTENMNLIKGMELAYSTNKGKEYIDKFLNNDKQDAYFAVKNLDGGRGGDEGGAQLNPKAVQSLIDKDGVFHTHNLDHKDRKISGQVSDFGVFNDLQTREGAEDNSLILLDDDDHFNIHTNDNIKYTDKEKARTVVHEILHYVYDLNKTKMDHHDKMKPELEQLDKEIDQKLETPKSDDEK